MPNFVITAKQDLHLYQGKDIKKGDSFEVFVGKSLGKTFIFTNPETRSSIIRQLSNKDIDLAACRKEYFLNNGYFQVEERKNVLSNKY